MTNIFRNTSFFRAVNPGINEVGDHENVVKRNYLVYNRIKKMVAEGGLEVDKSMFQRQSFFVNPANIMALYALGVFTSAMFYRKYWVAIVLGSGLLITKPINFSKMIYMNNINMFLNRNFDSLGENYQRVLTNHDFRFAAADLPKEATLHELSLMVDWRFDLK